MTATDEDLALLRTLALWAADSATHVLPIFEAAVPGDDRPRAAIHAVTTFGQGGRRTHQLRAQSMGAHRAAIGAADRTVAAAARSASLAALAAYLHLDLLRSGHQHPHVLGPAVYAALAREPEVTRAIEQAPDEVRDLVRRMPPLQPGRTPLSVRYAALDAALR